MKSVQKCGLCKKSVTLLDYYIGLDSLQVILRKSNFQQTLKVVKDERDR